MRLLLDEHLSPRIAIQLRAAGYDVVAVAEDPDLRGGRDAAITDHALHAQRVIVTFDVRDHVALLASAHRLAVVHPGLVLLSTPAWQPSAAGVGRLVGALTALLAAHPGDGALTDRAIWLRPDAHADAAGRDPGPVEPGRVEPG